jgi:hypothetical protein
MRTVVWVVHLSVSLSVSLVCLPVSLSLSLSLALSLSLCLSLSLPLYTSISPALYLSTSIPPHCKQRQSPTWPRACATRSRQAIGHQNTRAGSYLTVNNARLAKVWLDEYQVRMPCRISTALACFPALACRGWYVCAPIVWWVSGSRVRTAGILAHVPPHENLHLLAGRTFTSQATRSRPMSTSATSPSEWSCARGCNARASSGESIRLLDVSP